MTCHCDMRHDIILGPSQHFVTKTGDTWELLNQQKLLIVTLIRLFAMTNDISFVVKFLKVPWKLLDALVSERAILNSDVHNIQRKQARIMRKFCKYTYIQSTY